MNNFKNHEHRCEIKLLKIKQWQKFCPMYGKLSEDESECDTCIHMIRIYFKDDSNTIIDRIER
jgi:hypothetical protein